MNHVDPVVAELRRIRERRGISQVALARRAGFHQSQLCEWESGTVQPTVGRLRAWCDALGVELVVPTVVDELVAERFGVAG